MGGSVAGARRLNDLGAVDSDVCTAVELFLGTAADTGSAVVINAPAVPCDEKALYVVMLL